MSDQYQYPSGPMIAAQNYGLSTEQGNFMQGLMDWLWTHHPATYENLTAHFIAQAEGYTASLRAPHGPAVADFLSGLKAHLIDRGPAPAQDPQAFYIAHTEAYLADLKAAAEAAAQGE